MAFLLVLLGMVVTYFPPNAILPDIAPYHPQQVILLPALGITVMILLLRRTGFLFPHGVLVAAFWSCIMLSCFTKGWLRGTFDAFLESGAFMAFYYLTSVNTTSILRFKIVALLVFTCAMVMSVEAIFAYYTGFLGDTLLHINYDQFQTQLLRVRSYGTLSDANDFAQFLIVSIALLGAFWVRKHTIRNVLLLAPPAALMLFTIYLTESRGAIFGLLTITYVAISRRLGKVPSALLAGLLFATLLGLNFGGGREMSLQEGSAAGRVMAWGTGIAQLRGHPAFGVGFGRFLDYNDLTAHNSAVLCFAELGLVGYFFWLAMIIATVIALEQLTHLPMKNPEDVTFHQQLTTIRMALYGFLATAFFLSRTYQVTLYILLGAASSLILIGRRMYPGWRVPVSKWFKWTVIVEIISVIVIYLFVRIRTATM